MFQKIKDFFKAPVFKDEDKSRIAAILNIMAWGMIVINLASAVTMLLLNDKPQPEVTVYSILILISGVSLFAVQKGYVRPASYLFSLTMLATAITASLLFGGVSGPSAGSYIAIPLIVNLMLGIQAGWIFSVLSIGSIIVLVVVELNGWVDMQVGHSTTIEIAAGLVSVVIFAILIQYLFTHRLNQTLERARKNEKLQRDLNQKLQNARKDMEAQARELAEINQTLEYRV